MARPLLSDRAVASLRRTVGRALAHTCDRLARTAGADDAHGNATYTYPAAETAVPCLYQARRVETVDGRGPILIDTPSLLLAHDTPFVQGDQVQGIRDAAGTLLLAGPSALEVLVPEARPGSVVFVRADLRRAEVP